MQGSVRSAVLMAAEHQQAKQRTHCFGEEVANRTSDRLEPAAAYFGGRVYEKRSRVVGNGEGRATPAGRTEVGGGGCRGVADGASEQGFPPKGDEGEPTREGEWEDANLEEDTERKGSPATLPRRSEAEEVRGAPEGV